MVLRIDCDGSHIRYTNNGTGIGGLSVKLISAQVNGDGSWDVVVEVNGTNRAVTIPASVTPILTDSASVQAYLNNQFPTVSAPSFLTNMVGKSW